MAFEYRPTDAGWAEVSFRVGDASVDLAVSHIGQPLDDLIVAALAMARGELRAEVYWQAEDGDRYWWEVTREYGLLHIEVAKIWNGWAGQQGGLLLAGDCSALALSAAIAEGTMRLYLRIGLSGYRSLTSSSFPVDALDDLERVGVGPVP